MPSKFPSSPMYFLLRVLTVLASCISFAHAADARNLSVQKATNTEKRVALVIGNGRYTSGAALKNSTNDARDMASSLRGLGFEVIEKRDVTQKEMNRAIIEFGNKLTPDTVALFYFAGHGMQVRGKNYLLPVDAQIGNESTVRAETVDVDTVLDQLGASPLNIVILDACRNNPFERKFRSTGGGLAQIDAPKGTLIAYATAPGHTAADGDGKNGLYTQELLKAMQQPGLTVEQVFKRVRSGVTRASNDQQTPWESSSLTGEFYFKAGTQVAQLGGSISTSGRSKEQIEDELWDAIKNDDKVSVIEEYIKQYPKGRYLAQAKVRIAKLTAEARQPAPTVPVAAPSVPQGTTSVAPTISTAEGRSGTVFKDCTECPEMVEIPAGSFEMGSNENFTGNADWDNRYKPVHSVRISKTFALAKTELTRGQFAAFVSASGYDAGNSCSIWTGSKWEDTAGRNWRNPGFSQSDADPVTCVNWEDAQAYVQWLSQKSGKSYRLPSEAEWEYACKAGSTQAYCGSDSVDSVAWYNGNSGSKTHAVAGKQANAWGLFDMTGNVWEWTQDCWNETYSGAPTDGTAWSSGTCGQRAIRGGSWYYAPQIVRAAVRSGGDTTLRNYFRGFRLARMLP